MFNLLLDFSLYVTAVVSTAVFALLDHIRTSLNAPTERKHDLRLMESCASILIIYPCHTVPQLQAMLANAIHAKKMHYQVNHVHEPGVIKNVLMALIINLYSTPLFLVVKTIPFFTFPMNMTLLSVF